MAVTRLYPVPQWPAEGYPDWPPVRERLRGEFGTRFDFLETDLFRDGFQLSSGPAASGEPDGRAAKVRDSWAPIVILDKNPWDVRSIARQNGLFTDEERENVMWSGVNRLAEGKARGVIDGKVRVLTAHDVLTNWHDSAVDPDEECRKSGRRRVIRWLVRQAARDEKRAQLRTFDPQLHDLIDPTTERSDGRERRQATVEGVTAASDPLDRLIFDMHRRQGLTLQEVKDELMASGRRLSIATIHRRAKRIAAAVRASWESGSQADE